MEEAARLATAEDRAALLALASAAREEARTKRGGDILVDGDLDPLDASVVVPPLGSDPDPGAEERTVIVGTIDGTPVGYAAVEIAPLHDGTRLGVIGELYVDPEARAVGVGEAMLGLIERWCRDRGCRGLDAIALPGDRDTKNFFETFGLVARAIVVHRDLSAEPDGP